MSVDVESVENFCHDGASNTFEEHLIDFVLEIAKTDRSVKKNDQKREGN